MRRLVCLLLLVTTAGLWAADEMGEDCDFGRDLAAKRAIVGGQLSAKNVEYLAEQRKILDTLWKTANNNHFEADHAIWRTLVGQSVGLHAIYFGKAGAGKSDLLREMTHIPRMRPNGIPQMDVYATLVHEQMGDTAIKGYVSLKSMLKQPLKKSVRKGADRAEIEKAIGKSAEKIRKAVVEETSHGTIHNANTMIQYAQAMLDEVDKGNPITLAALLDVLNEKIAQYGFQTQKVRTFFVGMTGNKTLFEFLEAFRKLGYPGTGEALLDRVPFKIYMHDHLTDPVLVRAMMKRNMDRKREQALLELADPFADFRSQTAQVTHYRSKLPDLDTRWLGRLAQSFVAFDDSAQERLQNVADKMRLFYGGKVKSNEVDIANALRDGQTAHGYQPPSAVSNRTLGGVFPEQVRMSTFLRLLRTPDDFKQGFTTNEIATRMNKGDLVVRGASAWRVHETILTSTVGDAFLSRDASKKLKVQFGEGLNLLQALSSDSREQTSLTNISLERDEFIKVIDEELAEHKGKNTKDELEEEILSKTK